MVVRLFFKIFKPKTIELLDYIASYKSQWADGGTPVEVLEKKYSRVLLSDLVDKGYLRIEEESIGIAVDDYTPTRKVYHLEEKSLKMASAKKSTNGNYDQWLWWVMGIVGSIIAGLTLAYGFGVGR